MSFSPGSSRPFTRGGNGLVDFRGAVTARQSTSGLVGSDPQMLGEDFWGQIGSLVYRAVGRGATQSLIGVSALGAGGSALGGCTVKLFYASNNALAAVTVSDAAGNFRFDNPGTGPFRIRIYKPGSPDVAGVSLNTLMPT